MVTSVFGGSNSVPERPKWLAYGDSTCSEYIYGECVRSEIQSARKISNNSIAQRSF